MRSTKTTRARAQKRVRDKRLMWLILLSLAVVLAVIAFPKEPYYHARTTTDEGVTVSTMMGLRISEVMSDNAGALPDDHGLFPDWVEIWNSTDQPMNLKSVGLSERPDKVQFLFPDMVLEADGRVIVYCDKTNANDASKPLHAKFKLSSIQCEVYLFDASSYQLDHVSVPTLNADESYILTADGAYAKTEQYSPGRENTEQGYNAYRAAYKVDTGALILNEIMASPRTGLRDEDDELCDWIEIKNTTGQTIPLKDVALSDSETKPLKWFFPEDAVIEPYGLFVVFCSGKDRPGGDSRNIPHTNFSVSAEHEVITLSSRTGQVLDRVVVDNLKMDTTYGRNPQTGIWQVYTLGTPSLDNDASGAAAADNYLRALNHSGVYISEVMSSNSDLAVTAGVKGTDYIELYNSSSEIVDLSGWGLSDNIDWPRKWQFPKGTSIWPGEYRVIIADSSQYPGSDATQLHANFSVSRTGGETVTLSDATGRVLDKLYISEMPGGVSYGRTLGSGGFFYYDAPTPAKENGTGFYGFTARPALSVPGGLYDESVLLTIAVPDGATVRYTVDGSVPTIHNGTIYSPGVPLEIKNACVVRARAFAPGLQPSQTVTATYVMNTAYTFDYVVCLTTDPDQLYNEETGILTVGDTSMYTKIPFKTATYRVNKAAGLTATGHCEIFDTQTRESVVTQGVEFGLFGQYSLDQPQKSFRVNAKAALGGKYFEYPLFEDRPFTQYKSFLLRNSGNDCAWTRLSDGFQDALIAQYIPDANVLYQAWKPVIVYVNGVYWGHYNMRERINRYFIAQHEGLPMEEADNMDIVKFSSADWGTAKNYAAMVKKIETLSPATNEEDLQYILDNVDVDSYFDFMAIEMFFGNSDMGNVRFYRLKEEGAKWKWIVYDLDYGLFNSDFNSPKSYTKKAGMGDQHVNNAIFRKLLEVPEMKDKFLRRFSDIYKTLTAERMLAKLDEFYKLLEPEMKLHFMYWAELNDRRVNSDSPTTVDGMIRYWKGRISRMQNTINKRHYYLYIYSKEAFGLTDAQMLDYFGTQPPKPAS